ncbi:hypothetical protein M408DRAFT_316966 [Serendipita vermifera MAFF 305830]|uniref:U3 small nucleolar RNA-associated protein 22 n=1 Tax=Serendipita vermifera MAFF 305830 TaxID=933852 RepID=A0A0C2WEK9_SERVB|nr:hypothetical protein M408DRAFT_316966 [Serendipita vermifera MAFF 305830]
MARLKGKSNEKNVSKTQNQPQKRGERIRHSQKNGRADAMDLDSPSGSGSESEDESTTDAGSSDGEMIKSGEFHAKKDDPEEQTQNKDNKANVQGVRALPSAQELKEIFEASELYQSNTFKLQIDDLLPSVSPKSSQTSRAPLDAFLLALHEHLMNSANATSSRTKKSKSKLKNTVWQVPHSPQSPIALAEALLLESNIAVPFPSPAPTNDTKWTFKYLPPESIVVIGSWAANLSVKHQDKADFGVDIAVAIPTELLQEKDYLNDRYFHKRALYLACLAASIKSAFSVDLEYDSPIDDIRMSCLVLRPQKGSEYDWTKMHACIRIIPVQPADSPIPGSRIAPTSSNLRIAASATGSEAQMTIPTPHSNTLLALSQMQTQTTHLIAIHNFSTSIPQFAPAARLLRVWANQRGFGKGKVDCVRGFENMGAWWGWLIGYLVEGGERLPINAASKGLSKKKTLARLGRGLSSYQLFRGALDFLSHHDFEQEPVFMKTVAGEHKFPPSSWLSTKRPVFIDPTSTINLLEGVPLGSLNLLRLEATQALKVLDRTSEETFSPTFLVDLREPCSRFDVLLTVNLDGVQARVEDGLEILDRGSYISFVTSSIDNVLRRALGNRVKAIVTIHPTSPGRPISQSQPSSRSSLKLGLVLDPDHAFRLIDRGPAVDAPQPTIDEFRELWGDKAELRRFADGSIVECVVWESEGDRTEIPTRIVKHVLARHFNIKKIREVQSAFGQLTEQPRSALRLMSESSTIGGYKSAMQAFDELVKTIKGMDLPLSLVACLPCAEELRYTSVFGSSPIPLNRLHRLPECIKYIPVYDAVLQFEKSARWPDDLGAIQKLKLAWFETIAREFTNKLDGSHARIAMDALASPVEDGAAVEVVLATGYAFRLRIYHDREKFLLERAIEDKTLQPFQRMDAERGLAVHTQRFLDSPRHHSAIVNVHRRHPGFSPAVRLVKRWFAAHLLSNTIPPELIELLCAYVFLRPDPQVTPNTGSTGFARTISFLSNWDWRREYLAVPLYGIAGEDATKDILLSQDTRKSMSAAFEERRTRDPGMNSGAWHIATEQDVTGVWWCKDGRGPVSMIADRVTALAKASVQVIQHGLDSSLNVKALFHHPMDGYDFVIHLEPSVLPRYAQNVLPDETLWTSSLKNVNIQAGDSSSPLVGFDPARELLEDLQRVYGDTIAFFYDYLGGTVIGCSWNPLVRQAKPFRALLGYSMKPEGSKKVRGNLSIARMSPEAVSKGHVVLNEDAILCEISRMGLGLIKEIVKQTF